MAIDIEKIAEVDAYKRNADNLIRALRDQPRAQGVEEIRMPGTKGHRLKQEREKTGIPIAQSLWDRLVNIAGQKNIVPPAPIDN